MPRRGSIIAIVPALLIAGCGGSSKSSSGAASAPAAPASSSAQSSTSTSSATPAAAALITTKHSGKLGTILAFGPKRLTVYLFEADKARSSSCTGACASLWPPVIGKPTVSGGAMSADLGTITRPDGTMQVTYKGHPLYLYAKDKDDGDTYGEAIKSFGAEWYVLTRSGQKVDLS